MESGHRDPPPANAEEEALKRNTDCVYFLASPLTCKKGNDCEYRHSEGARMNPRDCWFWLNGNCMNAKCAFRHPPLEGFLGTPGGSAVSLAASQTAFSMQMPSAYPTTSHNPSKQCVPCFYFQKGLCLKGDRCPFMHGSQPVANMAPQHSEKVCASVSEPPQALKKASGALEKCTTQQHMTQVNAVKPVEVASVMKPAVKTEIVLSDIREAKKPMPLAPVYDELPTYNSSNMPAVGGNCGSRHRGHHAPAPDEILHNGREAGEFLVESSPGFDVLVDDEHENSDYYHHEDEYGRRNPVTGARNLNIMSEFEYDHSAELEPFAKFGRKPFNELRDFDQYGRAQDQYGWESHRSVSDRILDRPYGMERRRPREESPDQIDRSDLRHLLLKQRKTNESRYGTSPDPFNCRKDKYGEEQRYRGRPCREQKHSTSEISVSSRLQGRIALPGRSSPDKAKDLRSDGEIDRGNRGRSSPGRPGSNQHGKLNDRSRWMHENFSTEVRGLGGQPNRRDETGMVNFAGPKSLAELKGAKVSDSSDERLTKDSNGSAFKSGKNASHSQPEDRSRSFEGPKPLSEILKRKREATSGNGTVSDDGDNINHRERAAQMGRSSAAEATETPTVDPIDSKEETGTNGVSGRTMLQIETNDKDALVINEGYDDPTSTEKEVAAEMEGSMIDTMEDQEFEEYDQRDDGDGEYEYFEMGKGGEFKTEDENADPEDEYLDEDDGDDFSTRIGAMFS